MSDKPFVRRILPALPLMPILGILLISYSPDFIETRYARHFYPALAQKLRIFFGWMPFSLGDLLYTLAAVTIIIQLTLLFKNLRKNDIDRQQKFKPLLRIWYLLSSTYIVFYLFWGLNYYRKGIADQLEIKLKGTYPTQELITLNKELLQIINQLRSHPDFNKQIFSTQEAMFKEAEASYQNLSYQFHFLQYQSLSLKPTLFGRLGNYGGFLGYYNPFTGEGQINTTCPHFLQPFVTCHEMAHQIGYASESEANFIGFLASTQSKNIFMQYSGYLEMYLYTFGKLRQTDSNLVKSLNQQLHPLVKKDLKEYKAYLKTHETILQDWTNKIFDLFLKSNHQEQGINSYRDVVGWVIAYKNKYGIN
jgi:hypothetical protein